MYAPSSAFVGFWWCTRRLSSVAAGWTVPGVAAEFTQRAAVTVPLWRVSGDLDGVLEPLRHHVGEGHDQMPIERSRDAGESVEAGAAASAFLEP